MQHSGITADNNTPLRLHRNKWSFQLQRPLNSWKPPRPPGDGLLGDLPDVVRSVEDLGPSSTQGLEVDLHLLSAAQHAHGGVEAAGRNHHLPAAHQLPIPGEEHLHNQARVVSRRHNPKTHRPEEVSRSRHHRWSERIYWESLALSYKETELKGDSVTGPPV